MIKMGAEARLKHNNRMLFFHEHRIGCSVPDLSTMRQRLRAFGETTGAANQGDGDAWYVVPGELRRFFVKMWVDYYEFGGKFESVRRLLGHDSLSTIIRYASKVRLASAATAEQKALTFKIVNDVLFEGLSAKGRLGLRLLQVAASIKVSVIRPDEIGHRLKKWIDDNDIRAIPLPWGYCFWGKGSGIKAGCLPEEQRSASAARPDMARNCRMCGGGCDNFITTSKFRPFWSGAYTRHKNIYENVHAPARLRSLAKIAMEIARKIIEGV